MSVRRISRRAVLVAAAVVLLASASPASAAQRPSFNGSCELSGVVDFDRPVTNERTRNGGTFRTQPGLGNCIGTLRAGGKSLGSRPWSVRARARGRGEFSCLTGSLRGGATMTFLRRNGAPLRVDGRTVKIRARIVLRHALVAGTIEFFGARGTTAGGVYNFTPSVGAVAGCARGGDRSLPMAVRMSTHGKFISLPRRR